MKVSVKLIFTFPPVPQLFQTQFSLQRSFHGMKNAMLTFWKKDDVSALVGLKKRNGALPFRVSKFLGTTKIWGNIREGESDSY